MDSEILARYKSQHDADDAHVATARTSKQREKMKANLALYMNDRFEELLQEKKLDEEKRIQMLRKQRVTTDHMGAVIRINEPKLDRMPAAAEPDNSMDFKIRKAKIPTKKATNQKNGEQPLVPKIH